MARKENDLTAFMLVQQLDTDYYDWTDEEKKAIESKDCLAITNVIGERLHAAGMIVAEMHCIIHDKDNREVWDNTVNNYVIEQKPEHIHCLVRFWKDEKGKLHGGTLPKISQVIGVEPQYIEKPKKGSYAYDNMLAYLIHIKYADKAQYEPESVCSGGMAIAGEPQYKPYMEYYNERKKEWLDGRAKMKVEQAKMSIDILEEKILTGEVCRNQILLTDQFYDIYARNKRRCDDALDTYAQRKIALTVQAMENGEFKLSVFFIKGASGSGKSMFTDRLVKHLQKDAKTKLGEDWTVCSVAASNPFDEYLGEDILVMDDLRGMSLTASDWLKLLDPDRASYGSARYKNKKMACRVIIINSEKDELEFFYYLKNSGGGDRSEALDQFFRRIMACVKVYRVPDNLDCRRIEVGSMQETNRYLADIPGTKDSNGDSKQVTLHYDFNKDVQDMDYEEAQDYLSAMVIARNGLSK